MMPDVVVFGQSWRLPRWTVDDGQDTPEFTFRAVALGLLIGCLLCFTNLYFGLQTGWISMMSLQSALLGFLISRVFSSRLTPQENVVLQTTATATGTMPLAAGFVGILPALSLLDPEKDGSQPVIVSWSSAIIWSCAIAFFGVFLSPPIRKQVVSFFRHNLHIAVFIWMKTVSLEATKLTQHQIIEEKLAFPSGTATAQLISVLHDVQSPGIDHSNADLQQRHRGYRALDEEDTDINRLEADTPSVPVYDAVRDGPSKPEGPRGQSWAALITSFSVSGFMTLLAYFFPVLFSVPLFGRYLASEWLWSFTPSLSYVGQGIIMGFPTAFSMNLGMIVGWAVLSPLSKHKGWAPGPVGDMTTGARGWILWTSLAIMVADSTISLIPVLMKFVRSALPANALLKGNMKSPRSPAVPRFRGDSSSDFSRTRASGEDEEDPEPPERLVPQKWVLWGVGSSIVVGTFLVWAVFGAEGIKPWATIIGYLMGGVLSLLGVRALGETDLNPVSGLGKISQLLFAFIQPGNVVANIIAGGVAEAGAQQAGDLMQDLKTGHLLRASPRAQFYGQLIGSAVSIAVTASAYSLYTRAYQIPGPSFPAPTAYVWLSLARLLRNGHLPEESGNFMLGFAILFAVVSFVKTRATSMQLPYARWIPSGVAFAIGFLNTPSFSIARLIGGLIEFEYHRKRRTRHGSEGEPGGTDDIRLIVIASGLVLGEGVVSVVSLVLRSFGVGVASCWGCVPGMCAGCPSTQ